MSRSKTKKNKTTPPVKPTPTPTKHVSKVVAKPMAEIITKYNPKILLSKEFVERVDYLHDQIGDIEWSAILLYANKEGTIDTPEKWVIEIKDFILMNIGSSAYTEYDFTAEDDYAAEKWQEHLLAGGKLGHLHTHHSLSGGAYFSGTDMDELHDNAPNHNYYLSLIVSCKPMSNWVAKVAICGVETTELKSTTTATWVGASGPKKKVTKDEDSATREVLYLMDCDIEPEIAKTEDSGLVSRLAELQKKAAEEKAKIPSYQRAHGGVMNIDPKYQRGTAMNPYRLGMDDEDDLREWEYGVPKRDSAGTASVKAVKYSQEQVTKLLVCILEHDLTSTKDLDTVLSELEIFKTQTELAMHFHEASVLFKDYSDVFMDDDLTQLQMNAIAIAMYKAMVPYESYTIYVEVDLLLEEHLMRPGSYSQTTVAALTGIAPTNQMQLL